MTIAIVTETWAADARFHLALERVLSALVDASAMSERIAVRELMQEIGRYLAAVDAFRAEGCEPAWRAEPAATEPDEAAPQSGRLSFEIGPH